MEFPKQRIEEMIKNGEDLEQRDKWGDTALSASLHSHLDIVKLLLDSGADINAKNYIGETPLILSSKNEHIGTFKLLLDNGADVNAKNYIGETPLMWASECGHIEIVKLLLDNGANIEAKDNNGHTALMLASREGHRDSLQQNPTLKKKSF